MRHGDLLGERARLTPDKVALITVPGGERYTYAQLADRARRMAVAWIHACGFRHGDRVGLLAHNRAEFVDAFFATGMSGIVLVPLGTRLTPRELEFIARDAGLSGVIYDGAFAGTVRELRSRVTIPQWIALDEPAHAGDARWNDLMASADAPLSRPSAADLCCLLYTSGTTGQPKGVMVPHRMVIWNGYNTVVGWQLREDDVSPVFTPLYHAGGLGAFLVPVITIGGTIVLHRGFDTAEVWRTVEREGCTVVLGVPTIYKLLMEAPEFERVDLSRVRALMCGGAPLPLYIIEAYQRRGVVFKQGYGLTEVGVNCFAMTSGDSARKKGSIGKPLMFTEARLVSEDGRPASDGEVGELWLQGPHVCDGYWNNADATDAALDREGWFHTGDLARRDAEGFFYIAGRRTDMLISGGVNVYPAEIEAELLLHPAVRDAAVVGLPDDTWGELCAAVIVLRRPGEATSDELAAFLLGRLAKYKIPRRFVFTNELPRTAYGKVVKARVRELAAGPDGQPGTKERES